MLIKSTHDKREEGIKCLIIGQPGAGKTFLASTLDHQKTLIVNAENGLKTLEEFSIDTVDLTKDDAGQNIAMHLRVERLRQLMMLLSQKEIQEKYDNVFVDSLTEIGEIFYADAEAKYPDIRNGMQKYGELSKNLVSFIKFARDLTMYNVFFTALEKAEKDNVGRTQYICNVRGSICWTISKFFDEVYSLRVFKRDEETVRALVTTPIDGYEGKSRSRKLKEYEQANLGNIMEKLKC